MENKVVIVTGGTNGIGRATVKRVAQEGATVIIAGRSVERGSAIEKEIQDKGYKAYFIQTDVSDSGSIANLFEETLKRFNHVDVVVASAGIAQLEDYNTTVEEFKNVIDINLNAIYETNRLAIKQMLTQENGGSIINLGSIHSEVAQPMAISYSASKGGVRMMTKALGAAYAKNKIRINEVCPAYIKTDMTKELDQDALIALHPIGRLGEPEEVANVIYFLGSDESSFVTASSIYVDGGYTSV